MTSRSARHTPLLDLSVGALLLQYARSHPAATAVQWPFAGRVQTMTYSELAARALDVAGALSDLVEGERVAVWGRNCLEWVFLEYACALRGLLLVPLNTAWTDNEAAAAVDLVDPAVVVYGCDSRGDDLGRRARKLSMAGKVVSFDELRGDAGAPALARPITADQPLLVQFTSGTTGRSKGAVLTHRAALNSAYLRARRDPGGAVCLNSVPFHHVGGSVFVILGALSVSGSFLLVDRFKPTESVRLLVEAGVTHLGGVPTMIEQVLEEMASTSVRTASLQTIALGGATINPALVERIRRQTGAAVMVTYGQSECPLITNSDRADPADRIANSSGRPCDATEVQIVDVETGRTLTEGHVGEVHVRSAMMMSEYYGMPDATSEAFTNNGFLRTGDVGCLDCDGYLTIHDRVRDVIIRGGENIYPAEVEDALAEHPAVAASAVVGIDNAHWGELVGARVVARARSIDPADLERFLADRLAHFKIPRIWEVVDELPVTASGKVRRIVVRTEMRRTHGSSPAP